MSPRDHLVGLPKAASIADPAMPVHDLYDEVGGVIYDLVTPTGCDEAIPARYAQRHGGPALDLGCGSGRITLPLAARGLDVLGVDLSTAMLDRLAGVLENEHPDIQSRVRVMAADMTSLRLDEQFRLIVLGATSIVLVDPEQRVEFFRRVRDLLTPDGLFLFDVHDLDRRSLRREPHRQSIMTIESTDEVVRYAVAAQQFDLAKRTEDVSFLVETIGTPANGCSIGRDPLVLTTQKRIIFSDEICADLTDAGMDVIETITDPASAFTWIVAASGQQP